MVGLLVWWAPWCGGPLIMLTKPLEGSARHHLVSEVAASPRALPPMIGYEPKHLHDHSMNTK